MNNVFFEDNEFGKIHLIPNSRAKRIIARKIQNEIHLTVPVDISLDEIKTLFEKLRPRLSKLQSVPKEKFTPETEFKTLSFSIVITTQKTKNYYMSLKNKTLSITCPIDTNFELDEVQNKLKLMVEAALRYEAKRLFPKWIADLATNYNFKYASLKINKSKGRWGSCSTNKNINLSYYCLLLPKHLVTFVMLHELCHTIEMNHGANFWLLLNRVTNGKAKLLTRELMTYHTRF